MRVILDRVAALGRGVRREPGSAGVRPALQCPAPRYGPVSGGRRDGEAAAACGRTVGAQAQPAGSPVRGHAGGWLMIGGRALSRPVTAPVAMGGGDMRATSGASRAATDRQIPARSSAARALFEATRWRAGPRRLSAFRPLLGCS